MKRLQSNFNFMNENEVNVGEDADMQPEIVERGEIEKDEDSLDEENEDAVE